MHVEVARAAEEAASAASLLRHGTDEELNGEVVGLERVISTLR